MHDNQLIENLRSHKNPVDPVIPYNFLHEKEPDAGGNIRKVNTIFLTNRECPFRCLMCDLWKNTLDAPTPPGAVLQQIDYALARLGEASVIKLYNSGNFFDQKAIPPEDYAGIADRLKGYDRVIVENHPKLCGKACLDFNDMLQGRLEIAIGLETIHPEVLPKLNKQITPEDFQEAAGFLNYNRIDMRTFILLNPPYLTDQQENIEWTCKSVQFAFENGSGCCSIIPTRPGNGIMDNLQKEGYYVPPTLDALEEVFDRSLQLKKGRVFTDLWDLETFSKCPHCFEERKSRLEKMNFEQYVYTRVSCKCHKN